MKLLKVFNALFGSAELAVLSLLSFTQKLLRGDLVPEPSVRGNSRGATGKTCLNRRGRAVLDPTSTIFL